MRCDQVRRLLIRYADGESSGRERSRIGGHLEGCPACREELDAILETREAFAHYPTIASDPEDRRAIVKEARLRPRPFPARPARWRFRPGDLVTATALAASVCLAILIHQGRHARAARSLPVVSSAELKARDEGRPVAASGILDLGRVN